MATFVTVLLSVGYYTVSNVAARPWHPSPSISNTVLYDCTVLVRVSLSYLVRVYLVKSSRAKREKRFNMRDLLPLVREIRTSECVVAQTKKGHSLSLECSGANKKGLETRLKRANIFFSFSSGVSL